MSIVRFDLSSDSGTTGDDNSHPHAPLATSPRSAPEVDRSNSYRFQSEDPSEVFLPSSTAGGVGGGGGGDGGDRDDVISNASTRSVEIQRHLKRRFSQASSVQFSLRSRFRRVINFSAVFGIEKTLSEVYRWLTIITVAASTMLFIVNSMPEFYEPEMTVDFSRWYFICEVVLVIFFTLDFMLRLVVLDDVEEAKNVYIVVDFLSFIGFYIEIALGETDTLPSNTAGFTLLRLLRIARILRLFKLSRHDSGLTMLWQVLLKSKDGLFLLVVLVGIAIMVFASILYYIEIVTCSFDEVNHRWIRDDGTITPFQSIPHTFWFIAASVTTVGYGDEVPGNLGGRAWIVLVMLFGVLVLSFPNILIGSNFSEVHRELSRLRARNQLGKYFRKVRVVVRFVRMWREFRVKGRVLFVDVDGAKNGGDGDVTQRPTADANVVDAKWSRRMNFFMFRLSDFPERGLLDVAVKAGRGALDQVVLRGLTLLAVMQRLVECFSGCATVEELTHSFYFYLPPDLGKPPAIDDVFELVLRGGALQYLSVFVLHREDESALCHLSKKGVEMLLSFRESGTSPCLRCYAEARDLWQATTRSQPYDFVPLDGYRAWQSIETRMSKRSPLDFCYDLKSNEAELNDIFKGIAATATTSSSPKKQNDSKCTCRYCNLYWGITAPVRPSSDYCFEADEELYLLDIEYAKNALEIHKLEKRLASLSHAFDENDAGAGSAVQSGVKEPTSAKSQGFEETLSFSFGRVPTSALSPSGSPMGFQSPEEVAAAVHHDEHLGGVSQRRASALVRGGLVDGFGEDFGGNDLPDAAHAADALGRHDKHSNGTPSDGSGGGPTTSDGHVHASVSQEPRAVAALQIVDV